MYENDISVLVLSCDKYEPYWNAFYTLFFKYWKDCPFRIYHCSESEIYNNEKVINISTHLSNTPSYWSEGFKRALTNIDSKYLILFLEDFFMTHPANNELLLKYINIFSENDELKCLRFLPIPGPDNIYSKSELIGLHSEEAYRISTQLAIWDKEYLLNLIKIGENPWEFESNASRRSLDLTGVIGVAKRNTEYAFSYYNAIIQNKLTRASLKLCKQEHIDFDLNRIKINTRIEEFYWSCKWIFVRKILDFIQYRLFPIKQLF